MASLVPKNHPALHQIADEVPAEEITSPAIQKVLKNMRAVLFACPRGVAIAAPQIGVPLRIFMIHDSTADNNEDEHRVPDLVAINPTIIKSSKKQVEMEEGCLSIPNLYGKTFRSTNVTMRAYDDKGKQFERGAGGLLAHIMQHEINHLDGILYTNHAHEMWETDDLYEKTTT